MKEAITIRASLRDASYPISNMIMKAITSGISLVYKSLFLIVYKVVCYYLQFN